MTQSNLNQAGLAKAAESLCKSQGGDWEYLRFDADFQDGFIALILYELTLIRNKL